MGAYPYEFCPDRNIIQTSGQTVVKLRHWFRALVVQPCVQHGLFIWELGQAQAQVS